MDQVIGHSVLSTLPDHNAWGMQIDLPQVMNVIIEHEVFPVHVLGTWTVAAEQDSGPAQLFKMIADNSVFLAVQIHTDRAAATMQKVTILDRAIFGSTKAHQSVGFVMHVPVML